jgi:hypothetical protein
MVRSKRLTAEDIIGAMERGNFYASTGVVLDDIRFRDNVIAIDIRPREGVSYHTQFIGTRAGYDRAVSTQPAVTSRPGDPENYYLCRYSEDIGQVLAEQTGAQAVYRMHGDEIYVRAKVISTARHPNPHAKGDVEVAWSQPVQPPHLQLTP